MTFATVLSALLLTGCGEKSPARSAPAAEVGPAISMDLPAGTKGFVHTLIGSTTAGFSPTDSDGATFVYTRLQFRGDGSWAAEGYVEAMDEKMDCAESGSWSIEEASSNTVGTITWTTVDTSCVGREAGALIRAQLSLGDNGITDAQFR